MLGSGAYRNRLARTLNAAYAEGLLSERTLAHRLDMLFAGSAIDPVRLVGDLTRRGPRGPVHRRLLTALTGLTRPSPAVAGASADVIVLALDWSGARDELLIGRHPGCDVVLRADTVSRRHARLVFRDGSWIVQDLDSTNGTQLNGQPVGRCRLRPGDHLALADQLLQVD
ncbi:MAG: FHA domain-containing protein [Solirubrobacterales bacterium]|nr:FHA domain-containing protein [Solirubrobacterales bacterium]MBV9808599.1 FHA domain-containing protein [Solirubrobacterales bacterium]